MGKKRTRYKPLDPFDAFVNAWGFHSSATVLDKRKEVNVFAYPVMVNGAFSLELCLKCLPLVRRKRRAARGHDLSALFGSVSKADKRRVRYHLDRILEVHPLTPAMLKSGILLDVESILLRANGMFEDQRYWHERNPLGRDSTGRAASAGIEPLANAMFKLLLEIRPEWQDRFKAFTETPMPFARIPLPT